MLKSPALNWIAENNSGTKVGYIIGSMKGKAEKSMGHVIALSICEDERRLGLGSQLMGILERVCDKKYKSYCTGLYVRPKNEVALNLYKKMGYIVYRVLLDYYSHPKEDGYDMRKSLSSDTQRINMIPVPDPVPYSNEDSDNE